MVYFDVLVGLKAARVHSTHLSRALDLSRCFQISRLDLSCNGRFLRVEKQDDVVRRYCEDTSAHSRVNITENDKNSVAADLPSPASAASCNMERLNKHDPNENTCQLHT